MESYGNENISFESHIPMQNQVYEGSYRLWQPALANPSGHGIAWIVMRTEQNDRDLVYKHLFGSSLIDGYRLVWRNHDYVIYASSKAISSWHQGRRTADKAAARIGHESESMPRHHRNRRQALDRETAATVLSLRQKVVLSALALAFGFQAFWWGWHDSLLTMVAACEIFYFVFVELQGHSCCSLVHDAIGRCWSVAEYQ